MKKLELKDICGYLPYGVKVYLDGKSYTVTQWQNGSNNNMLAQQDNGTSSLIFNSGRGDAKFILRPMSDLTEEITHRGEKFVPMVELGECANVEIEVADFEFKRDKVIDVLFHNILSGERSSIIIFDKLNEWMFDYRGLISAGLAIDVNTLPENPYEQ